MSAPIRILHVDDDPKFADLAATFLEREDDRFTVETATSVSDGLDRLTDGIDCVVSDYEMPDRNGIEFLDAVRDEYSELPFILFTGKGNEEVASDAISAGVTDYLQKQSGTQQYELLANRISNAVEAYYSKQTLTERTRKQETLISNLPGMVYRCENRRGWPLENVEGDVEDLTGYAAETLENNEAIWGEEILHPDDRGWLWTTVQDALSTRDSFEVTYRIVTREGTTKWMRERGRGVYADDGELEAIEGFITDVTEHRERSERLEQTRDRMEFALRNTDAVVWERDPGDGSVTTYPTPNPLFGGAVETAEEFLDQVHPDDRSRVENATETAIETGESYSVEFRVLTDDGTQWIEEEGEPIVDEDGAVSLLIGITRDITERKRREQELQDERAFVDQALDTLDELFYVVGPDGEFCRWNDQLREVTGYADEEIADMQATEFFPEDESERIAEAIEQTLATGETTVEAEVLTADGDRVPYKFTGARLADSAGDLIGLVGIGRDISERRERERELQRQKRQFEAVFNNPISFVGILDPDGRVRRANEPALDFIDVSVDEIVGDPFWETPWWNHSAALQTDIRERIGRAADGEIIRFDADHHGPEGDKVVIDGMLYPVTDTDGRVTSIIATGRDITEQKERERVLKEIQEVTADTDRSFAEQVDELLSIGRDALDMAYGTFSRVDGDDYVIEAIRGPDEVPEPGYSMPLSESSCERTVRSEETIIIEDFEREMPEVSDRPEYEDVTCYIGAPVTAAEDVYGTLCFTDDETSADRFSEWEITLVDLINQWVSYELTRQKTRSQLEQQNERLEKFASIVSHDLRNPLNVAEGRLELVRAECESEHLDALGQALDRMSALVDDILALAREGERVSEMEPADLAALSETCWRNVETAEATLVTDTDRTVHADRSRLQQLLENLMRNAVEHSSTNSPPAADDAVDHGDDVVVTVGDLDDGTGFYVADDGPGIPENERERVFESGYSTSDEGIGFGLSIVDEIAEAHGWVCRVTESDEGGARFEIAEVETAEK